MKKWIFALLCALLLLSLVACQDNTTTNNTAQSNTETEKPEAPGEPFDPDNQYAKDNNAYYDSDWER